MPCLRALRSHRHRPAQRHRRGPRLVLDELEGRCLFSIGILDLSFGAGGTVTALVGTGGQANAVAVLSDGDDRTDDDLLAAGRAGNGRDDDFALARFHDGGLDPRFAGGAVLTDFGGADEAFALALQQDGKAVVAGTGGPGQDFALARYDAEGNLDPSFGPDGSGKVLTDLGGFDRAYAVAVQPADGKIVVAGSTADGGRSRIVLARYNPDGSLDPSFGADQTGVFVLPSPGTGNDTAFALTVVDDSSLLVAGESEQPHFLGTDKDFVVARITAAGRLDTTFGPGRSGIVVSNFGGNDSARDLDVQPDGKIVVAGHTSDGVFSAIALARYTAAGDLDPTFGAGGFTLGPPGTVTTTVGPVVDEAFAVAVQPNGKIVAAGASLVHHAGRTDRDFVLAGYDAGGRPNASFGLNGQVVTVLGGENAVTALAVTDNGKLVVAGVAVENGRPVFALARYVADLRPTAVDDIHTETGVVPSAPPAITLPVLANDNDPDGDELRAHGLVTAGGRAAVVNEQNDQAIFQNAEGFFSLQPSGVTWRPAPGFVGTYRFTYTLTDGWLTSSPATITVNIVGPENQQAGARDLSFGLSGTTIITDSRGRMEAHALVAQPDNQLVLAGTIHTDPDPASHPGLFWQRYSPGGVPDTLAGGSNFASQRFSSGPSTTNTAAIQDDGKVLLAGQKFDPIRKEDALLMRFNRDGPRDGFVPPGFPQDSTPGDRFGNNGFVFIDFGQGKDDVFNTVGVQKQPDGSSRIIAGGWVSNGSDRDFLLTRFRPDGSLDTSFGNGGTAPSPFVGGNDEINALAVLEDGTIVVAGTASNGHDQDFVLARYNRDGGLVGWTLTDFADGNDVITALAIAKETDGSVRFIVAGSAWNGSDDDFALARYTADGELDPSFGAADVTFGPAGTVTTALGPEHDRANAVLLLSDGDIVVAGSTDQDNGSTGGRNQDLAVVRYTPSGRLDATFAQDGVVIADFGGDDFAEALAPLPDVPGQPAGRFAVATTSRVLSTPSYTVVYLQRYNADGSLDHANLVKNTFTTFTFGEGDDSANAVALQPDDGKIVLAGSADDDLAFALVRLTTDGLEDPTFGTQGKVVADLGPHEDRANAVVVMPDGRIVAAGFSRQENGGSAGANTDFALAGFDATGQRDVSFATAGWVTTDFAGGDDQVNALALQDGKIVAAGSATTGSGKDIALARYTPDGSLDNRFGTGGLVTTDLGGDDTAAAVAVQPDGKIIAAGFTERGGLATVALLRYEPDGRSLDATFGNNGRVLTAIGPTRDRAFAVTLQPDGKIVVAGGTEQAHTNRTDDDFFVARYNPDGTLDPTFGVRQAGRDGIEVPFGVATTDLAGGADVARSVAIQRRPDGTLQIVAAGTAVSATHTNFAVARYNQDGNPDVSFGVGGAMTYDWLVQGNDAVQALAVQPDDKLVLAGSARAVPGVKSLFAVLRVYGPPPSEAPLLAQSDDAATAAGQPVVVPVLANDFSPAGSTPAVVAFTDGDNGVVASNADGTLTYTPQPSFTGTDRFTYTITDGQATSTAAVTVNVFDAPLLGGIIDGTGHLVVGERFLAISSPTAAAVFPAAEDGLLTLGHFPKIAGRFGLLTTGDVNRAVDNRDTGPVPHTRLRGAFDVTILELTLNVPEGANYLSFDFVFTSNEYPLARRQDFNDGFIAELDVSDWFMDDNGTIHAPHNFAFDRGGTSRDAVSVRGGFFDDSRVQTLSGTLYNAGTPVLQAGTPVTPGLHKLYLSIFDGGDGQTDSAVFINNLVVHRLPDGAGSVGAQQPPLAVDDVAPLRPDRSVTVPVLGNDLDFDELPLAVVEVSPPTHGTAAAGPDGTVIYTPNPGFEGTDTFRYTVANGLGATSSATVTLKRLLAADSRSARPLGPPVTVAAEPIVATISQQTPGSTPTVLTVQAFSGNPGLEMPTNAIFYDVQALGTESSDRVVVIVPPLPNGRDLVFLAGLAGPDTGPLLPVQMSRQPGLVSLPDASTLLLTGRETGPVRLPDGRFLVVLDGTSRPRVTDLSGTVFAITLAVPVPLPLLSPPSVVVSTVPSAGREEASSRRPPLIGQDLPSLRGGPSAQGPFIGHQQLALAQTVAQDSQATASRTASRVLSTATSRLVPPSAVVSRGGPTSGTAVPGALGQRLDVSVDDILRQVDESLASFWQRLQGLIPLMMPSEKPEPSPPEEPPPPRPAAEGSTEPPEAPSVEEGGASGLTPAEVDAVFADDGWGMNVPLVLVLAAVGGLLLPLARGVPTGTVVSRRAGKPWFSSGPAPPAALQENREGERSP